MQNKKQECNHVSSSNNPLNCKWCGEAIPLIYINSLSEITNHFGATNLPPVNHGICSICRKPKTLNGGMTELCTCSCNHQWVRTTKDYKPAKKCTECGEILIVNNKTMKAKIKYAIYEYRTEQQKWLAYSDFYDTKKEAQRVINKLGDDDMLPDDEMRIFKLEKLFTI